MSEVALCRGIRRSLEPLCAQRLETRLGVFRAGEGMVRERDTFPKSLG